MSGSWVDAATLSDSDAHYLFGSAVVRGVILTIARAYAFTPRQPSHSFGLIDQHRCVCVVFTNQLLCSGVLFSKSAPNGHWPQAILPLMHTHTQTHTPEHIVLVPSSGRCAHAREDRQGTEKAKKRRTASTLIIT